MLRAALLATALLLALLTPAATADPLLPSTCAEQDLGVATLSACTPTVHSCIFLGVGGDGFVNLCVHGLDPGPDPETDADGDGWSVEAGDCNDANPNVHPGAPEHPNGIDDNCDGQIDEGMDLDGDGFMWGAGGDCDDNDATTFPGATEIADRKDNDCNGIADDDFQDNNDVDGDGFTLADGDCDDTDPNTFPGAPEIADRKDNDCNGIAEQ